MQSKRPQQIVSSFERSREESVQGFIPWWLDVEAPVLKELELTDDVSTLPPHADVVVIGAGVAGLSAALEARTAGAQVVVLEQAPYLGYGATGRNAGILSAGVNMSIAALPGNSAGFTLWRETTDTLLALLSEAKKAGSILYARQTGALSFAQTKNAARMLAREVKDRVGAGLRAEQWTIKQVRSMTQDRLNTQGVVSAMWLPDEGRIHPLMLLAHLAREARKQGVQIIGRARVSDYEDVVTGKNGHHWRITLSDGYTGRAGSTLTARTLVSAIGPMAVPNARIYALAFAADLPESFPLFWDASPYIYADYRPGNGRLGVSGGRYGRAGAIRHDARYYQRLADNARRWLPELASHTPSHTWAVDLAVSPHLLPELRPIGTTVPGTSIEGLGALGVLPGMVLGKRAGRAMAQRASA